MNLVNEQHAVAGGLNLVNDLLEPLLKFAPVLGAGNQRAHIQRHQPLALQSIGNIAGGNLLRHRFHYGGLAHAGLAHQHRVVLGAPAQNLGDPFDFRAASDDRIQLAAQRRVGQINAQLVQHRRAGTRAGAAAPAAARIAQNAVRFRPHLLQVDPQALQNARGHPFPFPQQANEQMLGADVGMVHPPGLVNRQLHHLLGAWRQPDFALGRPFSPPDDELHGRAHLGQVNAQPVQDSSGHALGLPHQPQQNMLGADVVVVEPLRFVLGEGQNPPRPFRKLLESAAHGSLLRLVSGR